MSDINDRIAANDYERRGFASRHRGINIANLAPSKPESPGIHIQSDARSFWSACIVLVAVIAALLVLSLTAAN